MYVPARLPLFSRSVAIAFAPFVLSRTELSIYVAQTHRILTQGDKDLASPTTPRKLAGWSPWTEEEPHAPGGGSSEDDVPTPLYSTMSPECSPQGEERGTASDDSSLQVLDVLLRPLAPDWTQADIAPPYPQPPPATADNDDTLPATHDWRSQATVWVWEVLEAMVAVMQELEVVRRK
ncbi:hypothetical protein FISHEDRAFT_78208 [Fistulina hepatica ATCC 64428]|nr:hypothetical protein FISHEDRAFT_78208 [Fistulina hepatica ATCC 64428]